MAKLTGISDSDVIADPDFSVDENEQGTVSGQLKLHLTEKGMVAAINNFPRGTYVTDIDPKLPSIYKHLFVTSRKPKRTAGGMWELDLTVVGNKSNQYTFDNEEPTAPTYALRASMTEAPFADHPKWKKLGDAEKKALSALMHNGLTYDAATGNVGKYTDNGYGFGINFEIAKDDTGAEITITSDDGKEFAKLISGGRTTYRKPSFIWTETTQGNKPLSTSQLNKFAKITTPRGNPPKPGSGRTWMLIGGSQDQVGATNEPGKMIFHTTLEFELSEEGGWPDFLYKS